LTGNSWKIKSGENNLLRINRNSRNLNTLKTSLSLETKLLKH